LDEEVESRWRRAGLTNMTACLLPAVARADRYCALIAAA
jgi:hypothetical protein